MTVIELFAGAGGASLGLIRAGFTEVRAVEWDASACATRRAAGLRCDEGDVRDPKHYAEAGVVDAVWSSFPCQAWSTAGKRLGKDDPRNGWPWTVDVLDQVKPRWFMAENVPGLTHHRGACNGRCADDCARLYFEQTILRELRERFAWVDHRILDAARFGVPQNRERLIIVAGPHAINWPKETHAPPEELRAGSLFGDGRKPWRTVREALGLGGALREERGAGSAGSGPRLQVVGIPLDEPSPTIRAQASRDHTGHRGGHAAPLIEDPKHPHVRPESPAPTIRSGGSGHSSPPMWLRTGNQTLLGNRDRTEPYERDVDEPAPTVRVTMPHELVTLESGIWTCDDCGTATRFEDWRIFADTACPGCNGFTGGHVTYDPPTGEVPGAKPTRAASRPELLDRPSPTVTAVGECKGSGDGGNPQKMQRASDALFLGAGIRRLTPAECAILQDFPADHPWRGTKTSIYAQIGNAVPGTLAYVVGMAVRDANR